MSEISIPPRINIPPHVCKGFFSPEPDPLLGFIVTFNNCPTCVDSPTSVQCLDPVIRTVVVGLDKDVINNVVSDFTVAVYFFGTGDDNQLIFVKNYSLRDGKYVLESGADEIPEPPNVKLVFPLRGATVFLPMELDPVERDVLNVFMSFQPINEDGPYSQNIYSLVLAITGYDTLQDDFTAYVVQAGVQSGVSTNASNPLATQPNNTASSPLATQPNNTTNTSNIIANRYINRCIQCPDGETPITINISGLFNQNMTDLSELSMTITDIYKYNLCVTSLCTEYIGSLVTSVVVINSPNFYSVIKSCDCSCTIPCNLIEKAEAALECICVRGIDNPQLGNLLMYGVLVYFFSALLYGNFDIDYVRRIHRCKFLKDLHNSRFCKAIQFFIDPQFGLVGYENYFVL